VEFFKTGFRQEGFIRQSRSYANPDQYRRNILEGQGKLLSTLRQSTKNIPHD